MATPQPDPPARDTRHDTGRDSGQDAVTIAAGDYRATAVLAGGGLSTLTHGGVDLVRGTPPGQVVTAGRGQVLLPWPNRIRDGKYRFAGADQQLALSEPARHNAIHGLVRWCTWQVVEQAPDAVTLGYRLAAQRGYPWTLDVRTRYAVSPAGLEVRIAATNRSADAVPFAVGMHPYLDVGCSLDRAMLTLPGATHQLVGDRKLPTGTEPASGEHDLRSGRALAGLALDDGYTDLERGEDGHVVVRLEGPDRAVELWADEAFPWLQAYTGDDLPEQARLSLAVEPMTAPADAFNSGTDLVVLQPGETWAGSFGIRAG
ncbi:MAG TPA: aldose 1-epimerase family protein [Marmoricola sp.]|jgi:aldose 1-epimerase|nr:aldose 1-epimerase family protein [Marmoricola sp.]